MKRDERMALSYIQRTGIAAVFVRGKGPFRTPVFVGWDRSPAPPQGASRKVAWRRHWCASERDAASVIETFLRFAPALVGDNKHLFRLDIDEADALLIDAARVAGISLTPHERVMQRARDLIGRIDDLIGRMAKSGEMAAINREFKSRRLTAKLTGADAPRYQDWLDDRLAPILDVLAQGATTARSGL